MSDPVAEVRWLDSWPWYPTVSSGGFNVQETPLLDADQAYLMGGNLLVRGTHRGPGFEARQIVRDGLRDVLDWIEERRRGAAP